MSNNPLIDSNSCSDFRDGDEITKIKDNNIKHKKKTAKFALSPPFRTFRGFIDVCR